jgi:hypothetical protein
VACPCVDNRVGAPRGEGEGEGEANAWGFPHAWLGGLPASFSVRLSYQMLWWGVHTPWRWSASEVNC